MYSSVGEASGVLLGVINSLLNNPLSLGVTTFE